MIKLFRLTGLAMVSAVLWRITNGNLMEVALFVTGLTLMFEMAKDSKK